VQDAGDLPDDDRPGAVIGERPQDWKRIEPNGVVAVDRSPIVRRDAVVG
jgi:hypothetical protein